MGKGFTMGNITDILENRLGKGIYALEKTIDNSGAEAKLIAFGLVANFAASHLDLEELGMPIADEFTEILDVGGDLLIAGAGASVVNKFVNNFINSDMNENDMNEILSEDPIKKKEFDIETYNASIMKLLTSSKTEIIKLNLDESLDKTIVQIIENTTVIKEKLYKKFKDEIITSDMLKEALKADPNLMVA